MDDAVMAEAHEQMLGILADRTLKLACAVQEAAIAADTAQDMERLSSAFHKLGRGLRQTLALQAKLAREARDAAPKPQARPAPAAPPDPRKVDIARRRAWLTRGVERCVWNEYERDEEADEFTAESLLEDLAERLDDLTADADAFLGLDPDALLVRLCQELGLTPPQFHPPSPALRTNGGGEAPADSS